MAQGVQGAAGFVDADQAGLQHFEADLDFTHGIGARDPAHVHGVRLPPYGRQRSRGDESMFGTSLERPGTWAIIAIAALVLFGYKRLPEVTRSVGKSLRIFKAEMKGLSSDDDAREAADAAKTPPATSASDATP